MSSAYDLGGCRGSTVLPRNSNTFTIRRSSRFGNGVYQSNLTGSKSFSVPKKGYVCLDSAYEFADLLKKAFSQRAYKNRNPNISITVRPEVSQNIFVDSIDQHICVSTKCDEEGILDALRDRCFLSAGKAQVIWNWWLNITDSPSIL